MASMGAAILKAAYFEQKWASLNKAYILSVAEVKGWEVPEDMAFDFLEELEIESLPYPEYYDKDDSNDWVDALSGKTLLPNNKVPMARDNGIERPESKRVTFMGRCITVHYFHNGEPCGIECL